MTVWHETDNLDEKAPSSATVAICRNANESHLEASNQSQ